MQWKKTFCMLSTSHYAFCFLEKNTASQSNQPTTKNHEKSLICFVDGDVMTNLQKCLQPSCHYISGFIWPSCLINSHPSCVHTAGCFIASKKERHRLHSHAPKPRRTLSRMFTSSPTGSTTEHEPHLP